MRAKLSALCLTFFLATGLNAQQASRTEPVTGMRDNRTGYHALVSARVVTAPGQVIDNATIVIRTRPIPGGSSCYRLGETFPADLEAWNANLVGPVQDGRLRESPTHSTCSTPTVAYTPRFNGETDAEADAFHSPPRTRTTRGQPTL